MSEKIYKLVNNERMELTKEEYAQHAKDVADAEAAQQARKSKAQEIDEQVERADLKVLVADLLKAQAGLVKGVDF